MAIVITEDAATRNITDGLNPSREKGFWITGTDDEDAALTAFKASEHIAPYGALWPNDVRLNWHEQSYSGGNRLFKAVLRYGPVPGGLGVGEGEPLPTFTSDASTQAIRLFNAPVVNSYAAPGNQPCDFFGNINVTDEGVEGVDIEVPIQQASLTIIVPTSSFTVGYQATLARLTATINNSTWRSYAPKEIRFDGYYASGTFSDQTTITYRFSISPNASGLSVGPITGITKAGWDYLWVYYEQDPHPDAKKFLPRPRYVTVNQVYQTSNFLLLGLGS